MDPAAESPVDPRREKATDELFSALKLKRERSPESQYENRCGKYGGVYEREGHGPLALTTSTTQLGGLMSYKQFVQQLDDDVQPQEAEHSYKEYKSDYISTQKRAFFDSHKEEKWFKDKYHPTNMVYEIRRRNEHASSSGKEFLLELQNGNLYLGQSFVCQGSDPNSADDVKAKIDEATEKALDAYVMKRRGKKVEWKYGCGVEGCFKYFFCAEFVNMHLRLKHPELVKELTSKVIDDIYYENYMKDPDAPGGKPKQAGPWGRVGLGGCFDSNIGRRSSFDAMYYDSFDDECSLFSSALPLPRPRPPFLIPIPGAGPLGPVVPAPPEIAIRMLRSGRGDGNGSNYGDPGFSSYFPRPPPLLMPVPGAGPLGPFVAAPPQIALQPYWDNGAHRDWGGGRSVRPRGPICPVNPLFGQDSQRMNSYQDLEAVKDEGSFIDFERTNICHVGRA